MEKRRLDVKLTVDDRRDTVFQVYELKDKVEQIENAIQMFWSQWGTDNNYKFYFLSQNL